MSNTFGYDDSNDLEQKRKTRVDERQTSYTLKIGTFIKTQGLCGK
jgi:hypothetical protein